MAPAAAVAQVGATPAGPVQSEATGPVQQAPRTDMPGFPGSAPLPGVFADPNLVFGDDALDPSGIDMLGTVIGGFGFSIGAALSTEYNSNFARTLPDEPLQPRFNSRDDWRITPSVSAEIARPLGRQRIFASGTLGYDFFARNNDFNRSRVNLNGGLQWVAGTRCSGLFSAGWTTRGTRAGDFAENIAATQNRSNFGADGGCSLPSGLGFNAGVRRDSLNNAGITRAFADLRTTTLNGSLFYRVGQKGTVTVSGFKADSTFPNQILVDGSANTISVTGLNVGADYQIGTSLRVNAQVGQSWVSFGNPLTEDSSGATWSAGLTYSGPRLGANLFWSRNFSVGQNGFVGAQQATGIGATVSYRANDRLGFSAGYNRNELDFLRPEAIPGVRIITDLTDERYFIGGNYRLNRILTLGVSVNHLSRLATPAVFDFDNTRALLTLRARI